MTAAALPHFSLIPEWFDAIPRRISRRRFDGSHIDTAVLDRMVETCDRLNAASDGARAVLVAQAPPEVFKGFVGSYGGVTGATSIVALIGGAEDGIDIGYLGEAVILDATLAGLDTCWVAGFFDASKTASLVDLAEGERIHAVTPLGHATQAHSGMERLTETFVKPRKRRPLDEIAPGHATWPTWAQQAAETVRLAPSGVNHQPWRLRMDDDALVLSSAAKTYWTAPIDFGAAMLHAELAALRVGMPGTWTVPSGDDVGRFVLAGR